jgi:hypothetical protein
MAQVFDAKSFFFQIVESTSIQLIHMQGGLTKYQPRVFWCFGHYHKPFDRCKSVLVASITLDQDRESDNLDCLWASKRDKIMNTYTIKSHACKHNESSHM